MFISAIFYMVVATPCKEFEMTSTGGVLEFQSHVLGTYELQHFFINERVVYGHMQGELYLFSWETDAEVLDGAWVV